MITISDNVINAISSPVRKFKARVELYNSSTLVNTFNDTDKLISFSIERLGDETKFFGFGVFQKINIKLIDINRELNITTADNFKVVYSIAGEDVAPYPLFNVTEVNRDENTNELSITAYDNLNKANAHTVDEITLVKEREETEEDIEVVADMTSYTVEDYIIAASNLIGLTEAPIISATGEWQNIVYTSTTDVNFEGTETVKELLDDIAEISGSIYYVDNNNTLCFKRLGGGTLPIGKAEYIDLDSGENRRLTTITHTTDLEDNISVTSGAIGSTQYIRSNAFIELNVDNITLIINDLLANLADFTINQFNCEWRGNPALEIGDKIDLTTKDNATVSSYVINDTVEYNGAFIEKTSWNYEDNEDETESSPSNLGEALKQTFAKVDKANKKIELVTSKSEENSEAIAQLQLDTSGIAASVSSTETTIDELSGAINTLQNEVSTKITPEAVEIAIKEAVENVESVSTSTGFTFNSDGLNITKSDSDISTLIDEDGMDISKGGEKVLTADNTGVNAINLTAKQYFIIGTYSRFEDYGERTGCFWIGG
ncbi:MAG: hypothetical protein IJO73_04805 [Clostridia bacterium]|nr:hypothetical protein [Clostridia bacterium]